jgi:hypothetical protein
MTMDNTRIDRVEAKLDELIRDLPKMISVAVNGKGVNGSDASWVRQSVGLTIATITIIGAMFTIVQGVINPINLQIKYLQTSTGKHQDTVGHMGAIAEVYAIKEGLVSLGRQHEIQLVNLEKRLILQDIDHKEIAETEVEDIQRQVEDLKEMVAMKAQDRFTGSEGKMMQKQIDRLEDRLTFITKNTLRMPE